MACLDVGPIRPKFPGLNKIYSSEETVGYQEDGPRTSDYSSDHDIVSVISSRHSNPTSLTGSEDQIGSAISSDSGFGSKMISDQDLTGKYECRIVEKVEKVVNGSYPPRKVVLGNEDAADAGHMDDVTEKNAVLKVDGHVRVCGITTDKYRRHGDVERSHFVNKAPGTMDVVGETGIREYDELLKVNGKKLKNKSQKKVLKKFKRITADRNGAINMNLVLRRWIHNGDKTEIYQVELKLQLLEREDQDVLAERSASESRYLRSKSNPSSCAEFQEKSCDTFRLHDLSGGFCLQSNKTGDVVAASCGQNDYVNRTYHYVQHLNEPPDWEAFLVVIGFETKDGSLRWLEGDHDNRLRFVERDDPEQTDNCPIDERFFRVIESGDIMVLRSCMYNGLYITYDANTGQRFRLTSVADTCRDLDSTCFRGCRFEYFSQKHDQKKKKKRTAGAFRKLLACVRP